MEVPEPTGDRLFVVSEDDRRGSLWVVSIICCAYILLLMVLRATARRSTWGADDYLATAATCTGIVHFAFTFLAITNHLGRPLSDLSDSQVDRIGMAYLTSDAFMFLTLFLTKCAVVVLCRRLFSINMKQHRIICDATIAFITLWCLGSVLAALASCSKLHRIGYEGSHCSNMMVRWQCIGIIDGLTELLIVILALIVVFPLQMSVQKKIAVACSFLPRLLIIVLIALHLDNLKQALSAAIQTWSSKLVDITIYREVQIVYAVFTAALPAINRLLRKFDTSMGHVSNSGSGSGYRYGLSSSNGAIISRQQRSYASRSGMKPLASVAESYQLHSIDQPGPRENVHGKASAIERDLLSDAPDQHVHRNNKPAFSKTFRPESNHYVASARGPRMKNARMSQGLSDMDVAESVERADSRSEGSVDSQANIIRKDVTWDVRSEAVR